MLGFGIILGFNFLGWLIQNWFSVPLPANVIGLLLFVTALFCRWIKMEWVEFSAHFLLKHMILFFTPIIVGSQVLFPVMREQWVTIGVSWFGSSLFALLVTGWITKGMKKREKDDRAELSI